ncbi:MAG: hypothetical protein K1X94_30665 [Sandaracinaceae bacterium]|nr:hypothetical protein [Sandaracinaceae bacterium]
MIERVEIVSRICIVGASGLLAASVAGCCFGGHPSVPPPPVTSPGTTVGPGTVTPVAAGSSITLAPGFAPDPTLTVGNAGGPVEASTMGAACRGTIGLGPNIALTTTAAIPNLRIVVSSAQDTTLVVRLSDGRVLCDDDGGGYPNPMVSGSFPPGTHQVYVGTYNASATGAGFSLGFTTNPTVNAGSLTAVPPPPIPVAGGAVPRECGLRVAQFGPLSIGSSVLLGAHSSWTGPNGQGGVVTPGAEEELNWTPEMQPFVGQRTTITSLEGLDGAGCAVAKVAADGGQFYWRVRDMTL